MDTDGLKRTVLNGDLALSVLGAQDGLIDAPLLDDRADCALAVRAVIGRVLTKLQGCLIAFKNTRFITCYFFSVVIHVIITYEKNK